MTKIRLCLTQILLIFSFSCLPSHGLAKRSPVLPPWPPVSRAIDSITSTLEYSLYSGPSFDIRKRLISSLRSEAAKLNNLPDAKMRAGYWEAYHLYESSDYEKAGRLVSKALRDFKRFEDSYDYERLLSLKIAIDWKLEKIKDLYPELKQQEKYYSDVKDPVYLAFVYRYLSFYMRETGNLNDALRYITRADSIYNSNDLDIYRLKNKLNVASILALSGRRKESLALLNPLLGSSIAQKDTIFYINTLISADYVNDSPDEKMSLALKAHQLAALKNDSLLIAKTACNLGDAYFNKGQPDTAEKFLLLAIKLGLHGNNHRLLAESLDVLIKIKQSRQQWDSAFYYQSLMINSLDSLAVKANRFEVIKADAQIEKEAYENRLKTAADRLHWQKNLTLTIVISGAILILALAFGIFNFVKKNKLLKDLENMKQKIIDIQDKQLADYALNLNQKVSMINRISDKLDNLRRSKSISDKGADSLRQDMQGNLNADENWVYLKLNFEKEHPGYIKRLHSRYPELTEGEIRICVYIHMGFSTKHIATMLCVLPDSIKTFRYRIRRKFSLDKETNLEDFLRNFDTGAESRS